MEHTYRNLRFITSECSILAGIQYIQSHDIVILQKTFVGNLKIIKIKEIIIKQFNKSFLNI